MRLWLGCHYLIRSQLYKGDNYDCAYNKYPNP